MKLKLFLLLIIILSISCNRYSKRNTYPQLIDKKYDYLVPESFNTPDFETLMNSVLVVNSTANYKTMFFSEKSKINLTNLNTITSDSVIAINFDNTSAYGTGTVIYNQDNLIAILSSAHIFNHPDTMINYFESVDNQKYISSMSVKTSEKHFTTNTPGEQPLKILATDHQNDIILLGKKIPSNEKYIIPELPYPFGSAEELKWGSLIYLAGYPKGFKMLTLGMVSEPNRDENGSFIMDTMFNYGFSGGLVLAVRDGLPNFEIVGIATSATADFYNILVPDPKGGPFKNNEIYQDNIFNRHIRIMNYGITIAAPVQAVKRMLLNNKNTLTNWGFDFQMLIREEQ